MLPEPRWTPGTPTEFGWYQTLSQYTGLIGTILTIVVFLGTVVFLAGQRQEEYTKFCRQRPNHEKCLNFYIPGEKVNAN